MNNVSLRENIGTKAASHNLRIGRVAFTARLRGGARACRRARRKSPPNALIVACGSRISMPLIRHDGATGADAQVPRSRRKSVAGPLVWPRHGRDVLSFTGCASRVPPIEKPRADHMTRRCCIPPARSQSLASISPSLSWGGLLPSRSPAQTFRRLSLRGRLLFPRGRQGIGICSRGYRADPVSGRPTSDAAAILAAASSSDLRFLFSAKRTS